MATTFTANQVKDAIMVAAPRLSSKTLIAFASEITRATKLEDILPMVQKVYNFKPAAQLDLAFKIKAQLRTL